MGPQTLDWAYIEHEKVRIAKQKVEKLEKVAKVEEKAMQWATKAIELAQATKAAEQAREGACGHARCSGGWVWVLRALQQVKFYAEEAKIDKIKYRISFWYIVMSTCTIH